MPLPTRKQISALCERLANPLKYIADQFIGKATQYIEITGKDGKDLIPSLSPKVQKIIDERFDNFPLATTDFYICGASNMVNSVREQLLNKNIDKKNIITEIYV